MNWWQKRFSDRGGRQLPPLTMDLDDLREIYQFTWRETGYQTTIKGSDGEELDPAALEELSAHVLSSVNVDSHAPSPHASGSITGERSVHIYLSRRTNVISWGHELDGQGRLIREQLLKIARRRPDVGLFVWLTVAVVTVAVASLALWYAIDVGLDARLWPAVVLAFAVGMWALVSAGRAVDRRLSERWNGTRLLLYSRAENRTRRWNTKRDIWVAVGSLVAGGLIGAFLDRLTGGG